MQILDDMNDCTGCSACFNVCPKAAIEMKSDVEGFKFPVIDADKCVNCGLCREVCPVVSARFENSVAPACYAAQGSDELRAASSSGGAFGILAESVLKEGGAVAGAVFREDWTVEHVVVDKMDELWRLRGSKYMQSDMGNCYRQVKTLLDKGTRVLFSGTPCQVAGLRSFLKKDYGNLYCLDIICYGVPSAQMFLESLRENFGSEKNVDFFTFRNKTNGWNRWHSLKISAGGSEQIIEGKNYPYMASFLKNLCLRPSCGRCRFNRLPRQGDLTVGDFWLVDNVDSRLNDDKGTSVILVNNEKGRRLLDAAAAKFKLLEKAPLEKAVDGNPNIVASSRHNPARDVFFHNRGRMSLAENLDFCAAGKFDAAILNFWPYSNFGAILTGYALQKALDEMGVSNRLIWYMNRANGNHLAETFLQSHFKKFADRYMKYTPLLEDEELERLNEQTSCFIAGSDQIWRSTAQGKDKGVYYLSFAGDRARKIACAASFGMADFIGTEEDETLAAFWLRRFDAVSVREDAGRKLCAEKMGIDAEVVIDPVFYIDRKYYDEMADSVSPELPQEYVLAYFLGRKLPENDQMAEYYARKLGLPLIYLSPKEMTTEEWLHYIRGARLLVTNSFHGVCFAVIFGREFVSVAARTMAFSRFETVLGRLGLENRLRPAAETAVSGNFDFTPINWKDVRRRIAAEKDKALSWLKQALSTSKTSLPPFEDRLLGKLCRRLALTQAAADKNGRDNGPNYRMLLAVIDYPRLRRRYWRYKILSKITFGKTRKKYKEKRKELKQKLKQVRRFRKDIGR